MAATPGAPAVPVRAEGCGAYKSGRRRDSSRRRPLGDQMPAAAGRLLLGDLKSGVPVEVGELRVGLHGHEDELEAFEFPGWRL